MKILSRFKEYEVILEKSDDFFDRLLNIENSLFAIDKKVFDLYPEIFSGINNDKLFLIDAVEEKKTIETALEICDKLTTIPAKRNATLVSVGGGIVQDITGFVANVTYRGINWIFVPTTLLAACDSCIGGKTSLNYKKYKNLLGSFYPPDEIHIWSRIFNTLSEKDFKSGLGEVVKFNIMSGLESLTYTEQHLQDLLSKNQDFIDEFVIKSLNYKKTFIEIDEFDKGERIKLNFAHTFGHAIEVISNYEIPHGTAVAIGMIMANSLSYKRGYISEEIKSKSEALLLQIIDIDIDLLAECSHEDFISAIRKDKKQIDKNITAVLITDYSNKCELKVVHDVSVDEIFYGLNYFVELYGKERIS